MGRYVNEEVLRAMISTVKNCEDRGSCSGRCPHRDICNEVFYSNTASSVRPVLELLFDIDIDEMEVEEDENR